MKKTILHSLIPILAICALTGCVCTKGEKHHNKEAKQAKLMAEAKVSKADAEKTALAKVPTGTIKEGELEKEKGKLIWSFDIITPVTKDITEVNVDAITGDVVSVERNRRKAKRRKPPGKRPRTKSKPSASTNIQGRAQSYAWPLEVDAGNAKEQKLL